MPVNASQDVRQAEFEEMFAKNDDPWGFRTRWYELRKRDLTLACLPQARFRHAYEPGCANGELAAALATRCDYLLATDGAPGAVKLAKERLLPFAQVDVRQAWLPQDWPRGPVHDPDAGFDLIVFSELGFYLDTAQLAALVAAMKASLARGGTLLACHWRHPVDGYALDGNAVHRILAGELDMPHLLGHQEADFLLDIWSPDARSVAQREGFV
ncbi:MAG: methyltransferase domain-containing protein [Comamonadaceae bacterium]|nr:MAG: methyltransferase domain-containing protein [Comamonadaceae bacterium]